MDGTAGKELAGDEITFFAGEGELLPCYLMPCKEILTLFPESEVRVQKSRISFRCPRPYAWIWTLAKHGSRKAGGPFLMISFAAPFPVDSPLIHARTEPYLGRWMHHVAVRTAEDITPELVELVQASRTFRNTAEKPKKKPG